MIINEKVLDQEIDFQDVLDYLSKFFPEVKTQIEVEDLIHQKTNRKFVDFKEEWEKESMRFALNKQKIDSLFNFKPNNNLFRILSTLNKEDFPFLNFFKPLFLKEFGKWFDHFEKFDLVYSKRTFYSDIFIHMYNISFNISYKMLVFEIDFEKKQGNLIGETSEDRFQYYINEKLQNEEYLKSLYMEYESLTNLLLLTINNYLKFLFDILSATTQEIKNIFKTLFNTENIKKLINVSLNMGDTHNDGKTVSILTFEDNKKVVYKPRSLAFDQKYSDLLSWMENNQSKHLKKLNQQKYIQQAIMVGWNLLNTSPVTILNKSKAFILDQDNYYVYFTL
ncbi:Lanthionine synthetase C family protein [Lysinibacillus fusiformis ZC1]|nr:Lanthionine synthetase C family protein [Lysinibacillus fusiformis ZC1]